MTSTVAPPAVGESPVRQVLLCDRLTRGEIGRRGASTSLPGHLLQLTVAGRCEHDVGGRRYLIEPGSFVWFHEDESVRTHVIDAPWVFHTLNFIAPALEPPPVEQRVRRVDDRVAQGFTAVLHAWRDASEPSLVRELRVQAALTGLLAAVLGEVGVSHGQPFQSDAAARVWWELESRLRRDLSQPVDLARLTQMTGRSPATLARACRAAVGQPPMKRIKHIRLSLARGLVIRSTLTMTEIAGRIGYSRLHEFSRDYRKRFGVAPRDDRRAHR